MQIFLALCFCCLLCDFRWVHSKSSLSCQNCEEQQQRSACAAGEESEEEEEEEERVAVPEKERWDCESILSTYSNLYNHPTLIKEPDKNEPKKVYLSPDSSFSEMFTEIDFLGVR